MASSTISHRLGMPAISTAKTKATAVSWDPECPGDRPGLRYSWPHPGFGRCPESRQFEKYRHKKRRLGTAMAPNLRFPCRKTASAGCGNLRQAHLLDGDGVDRANGLAPAAAHALGLVDPQAVVIQRIGGARAN